MNNSVTKTLFKGLAVVLPVAAIVLTIFWLLKTLETGLASLFGLILPSRFYFPGLGMISSIALIYLVGLLMNTRAAQNIFDHWEHLLKRIPLIKSLYGAVQDILGFFSRDNKRKFNKVVAIKMKDSDIRLIGFVTQENLHALPQLPGSKDGIIVYLPMSYQIGGYMALVPRSSVEPIEMSVEDATRLVFTSGMSIDKSDLITPPQPNNSDVPK